MKGQRISYPKVDKLPPGATTVKRYADRLGLSVAGVYKRYKSGKVKIVDYEGVNWVVGEN